MSPADPALLDTAALWVARTRDASFRDWEALTLWLEGDPRHNQAYELALDAHDAAADLGAPLHHPESTDAEARIVLPIRRSWRPVWLTAAAAALVVAIAVPLSLPRHDSYEIATRPGEQRSVRLVDGTQIALNGDSRLLLDRDTPRAVRLARGEANFTVIHDEANPFVVTAGGTRIQDVGTVFNVSRARHATDVAVAEGSVVYDPTGARVKLVAGSTLHDPDGSGMIEVAQTDPAAIGAWRNGRLVYRNAPLSRVASELGRATGQRVTAAPDVAIRAFSGTIMFRDAPIAQLLTRVGAMTGTHASHDGDGWRLSSEAGADR